MKVLIVEDNTIFRLRIIDVVKSLDFQWNAVKSISELEYFLKTVEGTDLIISDIVLKDGTVFEITDWPAIPTLFITSFEKDEFLEKSFLFKESMFLTKPFSDLSLRGAIHSLSKMKHQEKFITIFGKYKNPIKITESNIVSVEAVGNYCSIVTTDGKISVLKQSCKSIMSQLSGDLFIRIQRAIYLNKSKLTKVQISESKVYAGEHAFSVSRNYKKSIYEFHSLDS
jgi:DNA-binding LytR/AlgR family response regulator